MILPRFDTSNANVPSRHKTQYFEMFGDHAIYHEGWLASTKVVRPPWKAFDAANPDPLNNVTWELYDFKYEGLGVGTLAFNNMSGLGRPGTGTLKVDGKTVATQKMEHTLPMILQWDESFDIGAGTLTGVNDTDCQPPFTLTAKLNKLTIKVDRPQLSPAVIKEGSRCARSLTKAA